MGEEDDEKGGRVGFTVVGDGEGTLSPCKVGEGVGTMVLLGSRVTFRVGDRVASLGASLSTMVGSLVGTSVGVNVGPLVGTMVGNRVGDTVGRLVGRGVVGLGVGSFVG